MAKKCKKIALSEIVFYVCAFLMTFSVFMLFTNILEWTDPVCIKYNFANPTFFDLIFGTAKNQIFEFPVLSGVVFLFIFQIILIGTCLTISGLLFFKKISKHTAVCVLLGISVLALVCAVLSFCSNLMISRKYMYPDYVQYLDETFAGKMKLSYGAYLYGTTMIFAILGSVTAFVLDHYKK